MRSDGLTPLEEPWVKFVETEGIVAVRDALIERGISASTAAGAALWLHDQASRRRLVTRPTATRYRRELAYAGPPPIPGYLKRDLAA
jgi:hypothetical protein